MRYGYVSIEGWLALACWTATLVLVVSTGGKAPGDGLGTAIGISGLAAVIFTARWIRNRVWLARTRLRSEAWYQGRAEARRKFQERSKGGGQRGKR